MQNFANAAFPPDTVEAMTSALHAALATLPEPVHSAHVNILAESILRTAKSGERDTGVLKKNSAYGITADGSIVDFPQARSGR